MANKILFNKTIVFALLACFGSIVMADDMTFNASVTHKFVWTDTNDKLTGGYKYPDDTPELQDACNPFVNMFTQFEVDFGTTGYALNGDNIKVCYTA